MITEQAKHSFEQIFHRAARTRLVIHADDACEIVRADHVAMEADPEARVVVLTISSLFFRLLVGLHFTDDEATRRYFARDTAVDGQPLREAFMEVANLCCGAMNQSLVAHFPDLGMSTPYVLGSASLAHLAELKPDHVASYELTIDGNVPLAATLCVCANAPLDFAANVETIEETSGELELF